MSQAWDKRGTKMDSQPAQDRLHCQVHARWILKKLGIQDKENKQYKNDDNCSSYKFLLLGPVRG